MKMMKKTLVFLLGLAMVLTLFTGTAFAEEAQPDPSAAALVSETGATAENGTEDITDPGLPTETADTDGIASGETAMAEDVENVSEPQNQEETSADADTPKEEDAEEAEFATGTIEISGSVSVDPAFAGTDDNDELLMDYIDVSLGTSTEAAYSTMSVGKKLEGAELNAYTVLKSWAAQVAKGEITNTIIDLTKEELGLKDAYTKEDLNVTDLGSHDEISQEAQAAISKVVPSLVRVNAALLFDNPYDLYWYDKSTNGAATYAYSISYTYNTETTEIISINVPKMTFRFAVAEEYANIAVGKTEVKSGGETFSNYYNLDKSKLSTVQTALTTIQEIVAANASKGAYEKLKAYKDKIDELVDYHETAMQDKTMPYGNPWQLIWVFDNDPSTKVVCEGYSKAFQYLFDLSNGMNGIDCRIVTGPMDGGTGAGPHMWNLVSMTDGKNYLVDVTNCDNGMIGYPDNLFLVGVNYDSATNKYSRTIGSRTITYQYDNDTSTSYTSEELALSSTDYDPTVAPKTYLVTFVDENGAVLKAATAYPEGTKAADIVKPADPTKAADAQYTYTFAGWTPAITDVTGDATYTATYNKTVNQYTVTWKNEDGTVLGTEKYDYGATPEYKGDTPKKADTQGKTYSFKGWSPAITTVTGDATYTATFAEADKLYTVTFVDDDGKTVLKKEQVAYGTKAADIVKPADPTKAADAQYTYTFAGWTPEIKDVTGDATYTATYNKTVNQYTVTWKNEDGTVLGTEKYDYGATPEYKGDTPKKADTQGKTYSFKGWSPAITTVTGDATYTATFAEADKLYTVTFVDDDGKTVLKKEQVAYGTKAADIAKPANPTKAADAQYTYTFAGWSPAIADVTGDATYTATYSKTAQQYTITWKNDNGTVLKTDKAAYGSKPSYTGTTPTKAADAQYTYTFAGWTPAITTVTKDATYTATYSKTAKQYTITWKNADGTVLKTEKVAYGTVPSYGGTPTYVTEDTVWTFDKWTPDIKAVTGDATYTATYKDTTFDPPVPQSYTGLKKATNGDIYYLKNGKIDHTYNGVTNNEDGWWYVKNGKVDFTYNGVANNANGWWKITKGKVDFNFRGFERNDNGWWYLENGKVYFNKNDVIYGNANNDPSKAGEDGWWLVRGSCVQNSTTVANNANGWWYVKNGKVDFTYNGVANNENGWWAIINGGVKFDYFGFLSNDNGWWYLENGKVTFGKNDVIYGKANTDPSKAGEDGWWLVRGSCVKNNTTVANNANGWWYVKNGKVDFTYNGVANNDNGWWKITNGKVDFNFRGFERNDNGWWYLENGKVNFDKNDVIYGKANTDPSKAGEEAWWLVRGSCVQNADTVAQNANGWWKIVNGKVDFTYNGVAQNENGWWKIENGSVNFGFFGFDRNDNGWWYLENGKVTFGKNDVWFGQAHTDPSKPGEDGWWLIRGSRVTKQTTVAQNVYGWWYVKDGKVDFGYTGLGTNENGTWYIRDGGVDFGFTGECDGIQIINGKAQI